MNESCHEGPLIINDDGTIKQKKEPEQLDIFLDRDEVILMDELVDYYNTPEEEVEDIIEEQRREYMRTIPFTD